MKITNALHNIYNANGAINKSNNDKLVEKNLTRDSLEIDYNSRNDMNLYKSSGMLKAKSIGGVKLLVDKGNAIETTVLVNRSSFDKIVDYSTFNEAKWEELGVDDEKRWVIINGQRFEVPHSPEEKAFRKNISKSFIDMINEYDEEKRKKNLDNNKETLKNNTQVVDILKKVFNMTSFEDIWNTIV